MGQIPLHFRRPLVSKLLAFCSLLHLTFKEVWELITMYCELESPWLTLTKTKAECNVCNCFSMTISIICFNSSSRSTARLDNKDETTDEYDRKTKQTFRALNVVLAWPSTCEWARWKGRVSRTTQQDPCNNLYYNAFVARSKTWNLLLTAVCHLDCLCYLSSRLSASKKRKMSAEIRQNNNKFHVQSAVDLTATLCLKKVSTFKLSVTLSIPNWFSKCLHC